jgi:hypothetical protein
VFEKSTNARTKMFDKELEAFEKVSSYCILDEVSDYVVIDEGSWRGCSARTCEVIRMVSHGRLVRVPNGQRGLCTSPNRPESLEHKL